MGVSYHLSLVLGVEVPEDFVYETVKHTDPGCGHRFDKAAAFCPVCGSRAPRTVDVQRLRVDVLERFGVRNVDDTLEDEFRHPANPGVQVKDDIYLRSYEDNVGNTLMLAGVTIFETANPEYLDFHSLASDTPRSLGILGISDVLDTAGIPFVPGTFGLHVVNVSY